MSYSATPAKLNDGSWGARVAASVNVGDALTVTTKAGKSWSATVSRIVWSGDGITLCATASDRHPEPTSLDGRTAIIDQHWSQRGRGPAVRLCAGGCGRRVGPKYATCYSCHQEDIDSM